MPGVAKERLETLRTDIRAQFRRDRISYTGLDATKDTVSVHPIDGGQADVARKLLRDLASPPGMVLGFGAAEYDLTDDGRGNFTFKMSESYRRQMEAQIVVQSIEVLRRRIDALGVRDPTIKQQGEDQILIQVRGLKKPVDLKRVLSTTGKMTFHLVDRSANVQDAFNGRVPPDDELLWESDKAGNNAMPLLVQRRVMVSGDRLERASAGFNSRNGAPMVGVAFDSLGAKEFAEVTIANVRERLAIVLDDKVISSPVILEPILDGWIEISGNLTAETANDLAVLLNAGALPATLTVIEAHTVGIDPGGNSVKADKSKGK